MKTTVAWWNPTSLCIGGERPLITILAASIQSETPPRVIQTPQFSTDHLLVAHQNQYFLKRLKARPCEFPLCPAAALSATPQQTV